MGVRWLPPFPVDLPQQVLEDWHLAEPIDFTLPLPGKADLVVSRIRRGADRTVIFHDVRQKRFMAFGGRGALTFIASRGVQYPGREYPRYEGEAVPPPLHPDSMPHVRGYSKQPCTVAASVFAPLPAGQESVLRYNGLHYHAELPWAVTISIPSDRPAVSADAPTALAGELSFRVDEVLLGRHFTAVHISCHSFEHGPLRFQPTFGMPQVFLRDETGHTYRSRGGGGGGPSFVLQFDPVAEGRGKLTLSSEGITVHAQGEVVVPLA